MSAWKMVGFWVVALVALTVFFMTPVGTSASTAVIVAVVMALAIVFVLLNDRRRQPP